MALRDMVKFIKEHYLVLLVAFLVGVIYIAPHLAFIYSLGDDYKGIPMMQTGNEDFYLARIREVIDGHPLIGSFVFYEYKNQPSLSPPIGEFFYAIPSIVFGISPVNIIIISRFFLPLILFLLVYWLVYVLTDRPRSFLGKLNALACALLVTLGFDLVDYRNLWLFFTGQRELSGSFLVWSRPVNPVLGAVFLFAFLNFVWRIVQKTRSKKTSIGGAALFLTLMVGSYFFSWGVALSVLGVLFLSYLFKKEYVVVKDLFLVFVWTALLSGPYWYLALRASQSPWYKDSVLRSGLFYTHYPILNKLMLATLALYLVVAILIPSWKNRLPAGGLRRSLFKTIKSFKNWQWFGIAFILGSLWAYSQQVVTGRTIWPYHFAQYTIPLSMVVVLTLLFYFLKPLCRTAWMILISLIICSSLFFGVYVQISTYRNFYSFYRGLQQYVGLLNWFDSQKGNCVVLTARDPNLYQLSALLLAFTHCDSYESSWGYTLMPSDRIYHNYLTYLRFKEIDPLRLSEHLKENDGEVRMYLYSNWKGLYGIMDFSNVEDALLKQRIKKLPEDFEEFTGQNFKKELERYRLDYILSRGPLPDGILIQLPGTKLAFRSDNLFVYRFNSN